MRVTLVFVFCLILGWHLSAGVSASAVNEDAKKRADELLALSFDQNVEDHDVAIQTAQKALTLFQSINDQEGMASAYFYLGRYYYALNKMNESAQNYESALRIWHQSGDSENEAVALIQLGYVEGKRGEWLNGFSYLTQAQKLEDKTQAYSLARIATGMGFFFNESGLPEYGLTQYQRSQEYFRRIDPPDMRSYNRQVMMVGYTNFLLGNYPAAISHLQQALEYFKSSGEKDAGFNIAECDEYLGQVYFATGKYDLALQSLLPTRALYASKHKGSDAAQVTALIGEVYQRQGKIDLARTNYQAALKAFRAADAAVKKAAVAFALGRLELNEDNYDAAENYLRESIETTENIRSDLNSRMLATAFSASVHDRYETYIDCLMRKHKQQPSKGLDLRAFQASELARARSLAALLRDTQTKIVTGIDPQLAEQERTLRQAIRDKGEHILTLLAGDYKKDDLIEIEKSLTPLQEQRKQIVQKLRQQNPSYDQIKEINYSVKQIQDLILEDDQTMLLEYFLGRNASYVWAITRNDAKVFVLPKADVITQAVRDVYKLISSEPNSDTDKRLNKATAELSQLVLAPVANQLNARRIIVVADGALNYIPFQVLPVASRNQAPLVANYEVVNAPSASVLGQLRQEKQQRRTRTRVLAAFGDPAFASNYQQLKNSGSGEVLAAAAKAGGAEPWRRASRDIEVTGDDVDPASIQSLVYSKFELNNLSDIAGSRSLIARGFDASRVVLERTDFSKYAILHFATHGLLDPQNPEHSGFLLSMVNLEGRPQNGFITMQDVYSLQVPVELVVLSACRTGLGKDVRGEGLIGLTRGFMHAGASSVVASLWKVDDEATSELMKYFYVNMLQKGMTPAEALREAQNTIRQNPLWQSPHFWAAFTLQGEYKEPIKLAAPTGASATVQNAVGGGMLLTLLAGIAWGYRRRYSTLKK